jgi:hypothetical protein
VTSRGRPEVTRVSAAANDGSISLIGYTVNIAL